MHDRIGEPGKHSDRKSWDANRQHWQEVRNARPIPPRKSQHDCLIPVTARIVWERDGEERIETTAEAWAGRDVFVMIDDRRWRLGGVWVDAADVRRR